MTTVPPPTIKIPIGYSLVETDTGYEIVSNGETMSRTVAFRLPASLYAELAELVDTFATRQWGEAIRWLITDDRVKGVIHERITGQTRLMEACDTPKRRTSARIG